MSDFPRIHIGACVVYKHKIISTGFNTQRTAPIQKKYNKYRFLEESRHSCHAETMCLKPLIARKDINFKDVKLAVQNLIHVRDVCISLTIAVNLMKCMN